MLNELNKNHMGGFENYGADDLYNMEDVWNEKAYDTKLPKKVCVLNYKIMFFFTLCFKFIILTLLLK